MRRGFTIIEVSLFLAVTGILFAGITIGTMNSINQQRYSDTVNGFADFLRNVYSQVANPQSAGKGNSDQAIYGKLITFGEGKMLDGATNNGAKTIFSYDVLGDVEGNKSGNSIVDVLGHLDVSIARIEKKQNGTLNETRVVTAGYSESYTPRWDSTIEGVDYSAKKAAILIVRHPRSGTITTLVLDGTTIEVNDKMAEASNYVIATGSDGSIIDTASAAPVRAAMTLLEDNLSGFKIADIDFCVNPMDSNQNNRQDVRISANSRNASGVEVIALDGDTNICRK